MRLGRICRICNSRYVPDGKFQKLCQDCLVKTKYGNFKKMQDTIREKNGK